MRVVAGDPVGPLMQTRFANQNRAGLVESF
jgi:hypothetical protein